MTCALLIAVNLSACVTPESSILYTTSQNDVLGDADRYFRTGNYHQASVMYSSFVYTAVTEDERLAHARYRLALSHYYMGQYSDAANQLRDLIEGQPDFAEADEARELLERTENQLQARRQVVEDRLNTIQREIEKTEALLAGMPDDAPAEERAASHLTLGDLYWDSGRFQDAVEQYEIAAGIDARALNSENVRNRVRIDERGEYSVRNPLLKPQSERGQVRVRNADLHFIERSNWLGTTEFLRLTGEVHNNGLRDVQNVMVEGTVFDFYGTVQGTNTASIGVIRAGSSRPFTMTFRDYSGSGFDIREYETTVFYDER